MDVICNTSPIIGLSAINRLNLLWLLFDKVIIPNEVYLEIQNARTNKTGVEELKEALEQNNIKIEGVIKLMNKDILITKEMLLVWNVKNVEQQNIAKMDL